MSETRNGFEWRDRFYPWHVTDIGKDLMLIDRIAQMPIGTFMELVRDADENDRAPVLLALIATSLRAGHPEWSVDRIYRTVMALSLGDDIEFVVPDQDEDEPELGEREGDERPPAVTPLPTLEPGRSPSNGSSSSPTPAEPSTLTT